MQENCGPNEAAERLSDFTTIARELIAYGRTCKRMETPFQTAKKSAGQWLAVHLKSIGIQHFGQVQFFLSCALV